MEFQEFPKIARLRRSVVITEKLDGTNAQINIRAAALAAYDPRFDVYVHGIDMLIRAGSRTRWINPKDDNFGFAAWVWERATELVALGTGAHFGEWWGRGIYRGYGLEDRRFSLFNNHRWATNPERPRCCGVVPLLAAGSFDAVDTVLEQLRHHGSVAAPGFMKPEGVVVYHSAGRQMYKVTLENDDQPKSQAA